MKVAFFHVGPDLTVPTKMVASCKAAMPETPVVQLTNRATPVVPGVDEVRRGDQSDMHYNPWRMHCYAALEEGEWLLLDTDVVVNRDVAPIFTQNDTFGVAMLKRSHVPIRGLFPGFPELSSQTFAKWMPFNSGVVFSRSPKFWAECAVRVDGYTPRWRDRWGDQLAIAQTAASRKFAIGELQEPFNYTPRSPNDPEIKKVFIVHYKGPRKDWMT